MNLPRLGGGSCEPSNADPLRSSCPIGSAGGGSLRTCRFVWEREKFLTIVGPSGTGKTTLLRVLGGLTVATTGAVLINGTELIGPPEDVVIVFQDYSNALLQWRTVASNVEFGIERTVERSERRQRVLDALELVGLQKNADDFPWQLSGGMQQRVQIARALALRPAVMLMDEPFAALDAMTKATLQDELLRVRDRTGTSFVFITRYRRGDLPG